MEKVNEDPLLILVGTLKNAFPEGAEEFLRDIRQDKQPSTDTTALTAEASI